jgi:hypothetical protein
MALLPELRPRHRIDAQLLTLLDETVVESRKHHWVGFVRGGLYVVLGLLVALAVLVTNGPVEPLLLTFLLWLRGGWLLLEIWEDRFVVTDSRIFRVQGVFNQRAAAMSLSRIVDFTMEQPFWGQVLGYGHLVFENAAQDQGLREIRFLTDVVELNNLIQQKVFEVGGGPAKHKRAVLVGGAEVAPTPGTGPTEVAPASGGWGTLADPDATGEIPRVTDED